MNVKADLVIFLSIVRLHPGQYYQWGYFFRSTLTSYIWPHVSGLVERNHISMGVEGILWPCFSLRLLRALGNISHVWSSIIFFWLIFCLYIIVPINPWLPLSFHLYPPGHILVGGGHHIFTSFSSVTENSFIILSCWEKLWFPHYIFFLRLELHVSRL